MTKRKIQECLMELVYMLDPKCSSVTMHNKIEEILDVLHTEIKYIIYDNECLIRERDSYKKYFGK